MKKENPIEFGDTKINVSRKLLAVNDGESIIEFKKDGEKAYTKQYTPFNVALLAPPGDCGQNCNYCSAEFMREEYAKISEKKLGYKIDPNIDLGLVKEVLRQLVECGTKALTLTGGGDWSSQKWFPEMVEYAKSLDFRPGVISHFAGTRYSEDDLETIVLNSSWLRGSLDGFDKRTYAEIRHPDGEDDFDNMEHNIRLINSIRDKHKITSDQQQFGVQMVICRENYYWVPEVVRYAKSLGVDYIQIRPVELRGSFESVDGVTKDSGQQRYRDKYDGFWQLDFANKACEAIRQYEEFSGIDIVFRTDKVDIIYRDGNFTELPKERFKKCVGSHFSGNVVVTRPVILNQCFWRYDFAIAVDIEKGTYTVNENGKIIEKTGNLKDAFFSPERAKFYEQADNSRFLCSNLCKYAPLNPEWETNFNHMTIKEFEQFIKEFNRTKGRITDPFHL